MNDYNNFKMEIEDLNNNLIQELPSYSVNDTQSFIKKMNKELEQQKTINQILKSDDMEIVKHIEYIKKFAKDFSPNIENQLNEITKLSNLLQNIIIENDKLKNTRSELDEIYNNKEYKLIAKNLNEIKLQKKTLISFLENMNVTTSNMK
tara:strand:- start:1720 stop:2166 length:447 start_codon:yes stop_codon:yes gene_type:complete